MWGTEGRRMRHLLSHIVMCVMLLKQHLLEQHTVKTELNH